MKVREVMTTEVVTVRPEDSIGEVANRLTKEKFSGVPVVNEVGECLGMVTERDLMSRAKKFQPPAFIGLLGGFIVLESPERFQNDLRKAAALTAGEVMTSPVVTISPDADIEEAATLMSREEVNRLPVVEGKRLVGIIGRADIIRAIGLAE